MRRLREIHLYLGCLFAPALMFFAVTGSWQVYRLQHNTKDGYTAPKPLKVLSAIHVSGHLPGRKAEQTTPLHGFAVAAAAGLVVTTLLGVVMAFSSSRNALVPTLCLFGGVALPAAILYLYR
ncbi:MAG: hypothetical protein ABR589_08850 [Chthoniobacterales bacterium]